MSRAVLPECLNKDNIRIGEMHAGHCCVDTEEGVYYRWSGNLVQCVGKKGSLHSCYNLHLRAVHGFEKQKYTVFEGESINITFGRNVKGTTDINRLSLQGTITSEGDKNGEIRIHTHKQI